MRSKKKEIDAVQPDYYLENGLMVFTETYHLKRGFCCKNRCRHCPYGLASKDNQPGSK